MMVPPMERLHDTLWADHALGNDLECGGLVRTGSCVRDNRTQFLPLGDAIQSVLRYCQDQSLSKKANTLQREMAPQTLEAALSPQVLQVGPEERKIGHSEKFKIENLRFRIPHTRSVRNVLRNVWQWEKNRKIRH